MAKKTDVVVTEKPKVKYDLSKIDSALLGIKKDIGEDSIVDITTIPKIPRVPTKSPTLGHILGDGGTPLGRIIEIYGPESSGKSLLAQNIGADYQNDGKFVAYIDTEFSFDPAYASVQGLDVSPEKFKLFQPNTGEDAFTIAERIAETGQVGLIIMDSVATMIPKAELEGEMTDAQMGAQARMMGKGLRKIAGICAKNNCTIIFINQIRMKIGVMFGNPETTPGGNALKFYASIRLEVRKVETQDGENDGDDALGIKARVKNVKNKTFVPYRKGELFFSFKDGIDIWSEYVNFGVSLGVVNKAGAWYSYNSERLGQGLKNTAQYFKEHPVLFSEIKKAVDAKLTGDPTISVTLPETPVVEAPSGSGLAALAEKASN